MQVHGKVMAHFLTERVWSSGDAREKLLPHGNSTDADNKDKL